MTSRVPELRILLAVFLAAGALWIFEEIHENFVREGDRSADTQILLLFRATGDRADPIGPQWVEELARDITALGGLGVLTLIIAASVSFLFIAGDKRTAWMVLAATVGGIAVTQGFKALFERPRPDLVLDPGILKLFHFVWRFKHSHLMNRLCNIDSICFALNL